MFNELMSSKRLRPALLLISSALLFALAGCASSSETVAPELAKTGTVAQKVEGTPAIPYDDAQDGAAADEGVGAEGAASETHASSEELCVRFLDVGQGDCALITCAGESLLIDGGPSSASQKVYAVLKDLGITHLDAIIATHPDADHCGGISGALTLATCGTFYCSITSHDTKTFNSMAERLGSTPITVPKVGDAFSVGPATVQFTGPITPTSDTNNGSLVCKLSYGDVGFLFTGDAEASSEAQMMAAGADLDADVLKVGHHGSNSSSSARFLSAVSPEYAVISVGDNSYGHPTSDVLARLQAVGADILRTDELGTITFQTDGSAIEVSSSQGRVS